MTNADSAIRSVPSHLRLWLVTVVGLGVDLWSKHWAFTRLDPSSIHDGYVVVPHLITFRQSLNPGALFGLGKGLTPVFIAASLLALGFVLFLFRHSTSKRWSLHVALGLVLAGALGNLYDRARVIADVVKYTENGRRVTVIGKVTNPGQSPILLGSWPDGQHPRPIPAHRDPEVRSMGVVRDFVKIEPHFQLGGYRIDLWPWVFNVADVLLVAGVAILMLNFWRERRQERATQAAAAAAQTECTGDAGSV
ncbi:MAG: signal peptidase II [Planctomycetes bacterium]|nr:signal peptidase II [Planctomycetota bacterium]